MCLIYCACGCEKLLEQFDSRGRKRKYILGHNKPGLGIKRPDQSKRMKENNPMSGQYAESHSKWKGGFRLSVARQHASRKQMGYIPLNDCREDGWEGHHIDKEYVIFIPREIHRSVYHSVKKNINMDIINDKVYEWFTGYYLS